jgi:hypothetical protein
VLVRGDVELDLLAALEPAALADDGVTTPKVSLRLSIFSLIER